MNITAQERRAGPGLQPGAPAAAAGRARAPAGRLPI